MAAVVTSPRVTVPGERIRVLVDAPPRTAKRFVLYWMTAYRRPTDNFALERAVEIARSTNKPLVILEALRVGYPWASDRIHRFVLDGMRHHAAALHDRPVTYYPYVEATEGAGRGLLSALSEHAVCVVGDDWPGFFHPHMLAAAADRIACRFEVVDACGLVPFRAADKLYKRAVDFRRYIQKNAHRWVTVDPKKQPIPRELPKAVIPAAIKKAWPAASVAMLAGDQLDKLPLDHEVHTVDLEGGAAAASKRWRAFLRERFDGYGEGRNHPDDDRASGLSPYLHFGHISTHTIFRDITRHEGWSPDRMGRPNAAKEGFWGMSPSAESFIDELVTWRELTHHTATALEDHRSYGSLPSWAMTTLAAHAGDPRPAIYTPDQLEHSATDDPIWNAAQNQLRESGRMHNYLRMLWGKKILEWTPTPRDALDVMVHLNNKYALDGRDPNSYGGIMWVLGRYDRAWGPERPIFGKVRYMSSDSTKKKLRLRGYLEAWG